MTWRAPEVDRTGGSLVAGEREMLEGFLAWQRSTLLRKCAGLTGEQLAERSVPPSRLSLLGLITHLANVERVWFRLRFAGMDVPGPQGEADFADLRPELAEQEYARLLEEMRLADEIAGAASLDDVIDVNGETMSLRFLYFHVIHEYARHNGHADLIRERVDGVTGA
ncbi:DinB family protein [Nonomuraea sp. NBC_01738]|uniref:DinB family protein n=1 Tax=Nonomuraea sp. NBC_01738 TaxID=2976003 RepID=UPI002E0E64E9|nr:DinB family protein [Nonomuraea sp. NBC_01738]